MFFICVELVLSEYLVKFLVEQEDNSMKIKIMILKLINVTIEINNLT